MDHSDYQRYEQLRENIFAGEYSTSEKSVAEIIEFVELYDEIHFDEKQETKKYRELSESYSIVLLDIFENVPAAKKRYDAMKALIDTYKAVEENK